jgi:16S rRNA (guanine527-N7)-methyltransferase
VSPKPGSEEIIEKWFAGRSLEIPPNFIAQVGLYLDLILTWSERMNIVSRNDLDILLERHILDSLVPLGEIPPEGILVDIGSGAGFPAIPISLVRPSLDIIMVESRRKKVIFLKEVVSRLEISRISIQEVRFEDFSSENKADIITIRAVAVTDKIRKHSRVILKKTGKIIYYNKFDSYRLL